MFRVIVCGSRDFTDYPFLFDVLADTLARHPDLVIVHGAARGADSMAETFAQENGIPSEAFPADWNRFGKSAGYRRNRAMADSTVDGHGVDGVIAFFADPYNRSRGTQMMVSIAKDAGIRVYIPRTSCWGPGNCREGDLCPTCWRKAGYPVQAVQ